MVQTYSIEFKEEVCKRVQSGIPAAQVARELCINVNTLYTWLLHLFSLAVSSRIRFFIFSTNFGCTLIRHFPLRP